MCSKRVITLEVSHAFNLYNYPSANVLVELALLRIEPRAATVRAVVRSDPSDPNTPPLKVAALGVAAFTRLLGPMRDIMERKAGDYGGVAAK